MIAGYAASPKGQEAIRQYLMSAEGKKTLEQYLSTREGQAMARLVLSRALEGTTLPSDVKEKVLEAIEEKHNQGRSADPRKEK